MVVSQTKLLLLLSSKIEEVIIVVYDILYLIYIYIYMYLFIVYLIYTVLIYCNIHIIYNFSNMEKVGYIFFFFLILNIFKNGVITFD